MLFWILSHIFKGVQCEQSGYEKKRYKDCRCTFADHGKCFCKSAEAGNRADRWKCKCCPRVALTFDDGPSPKYTPILLDGLKERNVHATFFLLGKNIKKNQKLVQRMQKEGHLLGNHTYNHVQLDKISETTAKQEILRTNNEIYETAGIYPEYMRPPYGAWKKNLELCVEMFPVFWDIDTLDWKSQNVEAILETAGDRPEDGSIILMHDEYETSVEAALLLIDRLKKTGYEFVTVDKLISDCAGGSL